MADKKTILVGLLVSAATVIVTTMVTPLGTNLKNMIFPPKYIYQGCIKNAGKPLKVTIVLDKRDSATTDAAGRFIFDGLKKGKHEYVVCFNNQPYLFTFIAADKEKIDDQTYDLAELFVADSTVSNDTKVLASNNSLPAEPAPADTLSVSTTDTATRPQGVRTLSARQLAALHATVRSPQRPTLAAQVSALLYMSPDALLEGLTLKVRKDNANKKGMQVAYHYYVDGPDRYLDQVKEVRYVRNHKTFPENLNNTYVTGSNRADNFDFAGYQWGFISTTYVTVVLKNNKTSQRVLKTISYDN